MFRKLREADRTRVLECLSREPAFNVFPIGDIENFGFEADFQDVWGDETAGGTFDAVLLRYFRNHVLYAASPGFDREGAAGILAGAPRDAMLSGKEGLVIEIAKRTGFDEVRGQYLLELKPDARIGPGPDPAVEWATPEDCDDVIALHGEIEEFGPFRLATEGIRHDIETGTGRTAVMRVGGRAVSSASSAAENSKSAMLIGVCTSKGHRGLGLATRCISALCRALLSEGKTACLFYHNPDAGRIYKRLGFRDAGRWAMATRSADRGIEP